MNAEPSNPSCVLLRPNSVFEQRKDREDRLPVRVVEKPAEPQQPDDHPWVMSGASRAGCESTGESRYGLISGQAASSLLVAGESHASSKCACSIVLPWPVSR